MGVYLYKYWFLAVKFEYKILLRNIEGNICTILFLNFAGRNKYLLQIDIFANS